MRFYLHFCNKYRHLPADPKSLPLFKEKLASKHQTAEQRAQAQCAVKYYVDLLSPEWRSSRNDAVVGPAAPEEGESSIAARKQDAVIYESRIGEEQAHFGIQAECVREKANATTPRAKRCRYIPTVLSRQKVESLFAELKDPYKLLAMLMYGCGLRLTAAANLRMHNFNFDTGIVSVQIGKGGKPPLCPDGMKLD